MKGERGDRGSTTEGQLASAKGPGPIRAVIFDYGNVLSYALDPGSRNEMQRLAGVPADRFQAAYFRDRAAYDRGDASLRDYWTGVIAPYGAPPSDELLRKLVVADAEGWMRIREPMVAWAKALKAAGIRTAILSNMPIDHRHYIVERLAWIREVDVRVFSAEIGRVKPEPEIYRICLERIGLPGAACLFIDDLPENVDAARREGISGVVFESERQLAEVIAGHPELPAFAR